MEEAHKEPQQQESPKQLFSSKTSVIGAFAMLTLILTIPLAVLLSGQNQEIRSRADSNNKPSIQTPSRGSGTIAGYVYLDLNKNGIRDNEEKPYPNANVKIIQENKGTSTDPNSLNLTADLTTDSLGYFKYSFPNLLPDSTPIESGSTTFRVLLVLPKDYKTINTNPVVLSQIHKDEKRVIEFGLFPLTAPIITPPPPCVTRPACLDSNPRCLITEPTGGWCPKISITPSPTISLPTRPPYPSPTLPSLQGN